MSHNPVGVQACYRDIALPLFLTFYNISDEPFSFSNFNFDGSVFYFVAN
jgi:hypothetical protein